LFGAFAIHAATMIALGEAAGTPVAVPDDLPLELAWRAPESCPSLAEERAEIHRRVGEVDTPVPKLISAEVEIRAAAAGGYLLSVQTRVGTSTGERVLSGPDCRQLAEAAALLLALLINPKATLDPEPAKVPPPPVPSTPPPPPAPERSGLGCGIEAVFARGVLPGLAEGMAARIFYQRGHVMAAALLGGFLAKETNAPVFPGAAASFYRLESALSLCAATLPGRRLGGALCLGAAIVRMHGESSGVSTPGQATAYWPEAFAEASGRLRLTSATRLRLAAEWRGLGRRPEFAILGLGSVYRPAAVGLGAALGLDVLF
jgi:hypothetical protein